MHQRPGSAAGSMFVSPMCGPEVEAYYTSYYAQSHMKQERKTRSDLARALDLFQSSPNCTEAVGCWKRRSPIAAVEQHANRLHAVRIKVEGMAHPPDRAMFDSDALFVEGLRKWLRKVGPMRLKVNYRKQ